MLASNGFVVRLGPDGLHAAMNCERSLTANGVHVFADGYIANAPELRALARAFGREPASSTSGWIALAYEWFGESCISKLHGQFSAVIADPATRTAWLLQDGMGLHALFYSCDDREIVASTSLEQLVAVCGVAESGDDPGYLASFLIDGAGATSRTPWCRATRLVHGRCVRWRSGRLDHSYPAAPSPACELNATPAELQQHLRARVSLAVSGALSQAKIWCELSAGLDSTTVLYSALAHDPGISAVSFLSARGLDGSDAEAIRGLAPQLPCAWHAIDTDRCAPFSSFPPSASIEPQFAMDDAKRDAYAALLGRQRVHAVLTGVGGDLTFGSEDCLPWQLADAVLKFDLRRLRRDLDDWSDGDPNGRTRSYWFRVRAVPFAIESLRSHLSNGRRGSGELPDWLRVSTLRGALRDAPADAPPVGGDHEHGRACLWREAFRQAAMAGAIDRGCAASFRHPLLDRRLLDFALALPYRLRNTSGSDRTLQRAALVGVIPEQVRTRRSKGTSQAALDSGLRASREWRDLLHRARNLQALGYVDVAKWRAAVDRAVFGVYESAAHFYRAAALEAWLEFRASPRRSGVALEAIA